ncbi:MAG: hypothetical protein HY974_03265 [Candidatus Kerfeldbacteria bacterium]|nr:hypothetical protein [Candidatus Kerfeldbacteria bacterium]
MKIIFPNLFTGRIVRLVPLLLLALILSGASCGFRVRTATPNGGVYRTSDGGKTWRQVVAAGLVKDKPVTIANLDIKKLLISPLDDRVVYALAGRDGVYESQDSGENWHKFFSSLAVQDLVLHPQLRDTLYLAAANRILRTSNGGKDWQEVYLESTPDVSITTLVIDTKNAQVLYAGTSNGGLLRSQDGGSSWQQVHFFKFKQKVAQIAVSPQDSKVIYAALPSGSLWRTADSGQNWTEVSLVFRDKLKINIGSYRALTFLPAGKDGLLYATQYGLFRSLDGGTSWEEVKLVTPPNSINITGLVVSPGNGQEISYVAPAAFYRSRDGGRSWETMSLPANRHPAALVMSPREAKVLYLGFSK